jgi:hypothetical protein
MDLTADSPGMNSLGRRWFVIVSVAEPERILERFQAVNWAPAIMLYAEKLAARTFSEPVSLRVALPSEI